MILAIKLLIGLIGIGFSYAIFRWQVNRSKRDGYTYTLDIYLKSLFLLGVSLVFIFATLKDVWEI